MLLFSSGPSISISPSHSRSRSILSLPQALPCARVLPTRLSFSTHKHEHDLTEWRLHRNRSVICRYFNIYVCLGHLCYTLWPYLCFAFDFFSFVCRNLLYLTLMLLKLTDHHLLLLKVVLLSIWKCDSPLHILERCLIINFWRQVLWWASRPFFEMRNNIWKEKIFLRKLQKDIKKLVEN